MKKIGTNREAEKLWEGFHKENNLAHWHSGKFLFLAGYESAMKDACTHSGEQGREIGALKAENARFRTIAHQLYSALNVADIYVDERENYRASKNVKNALVSYELLDQESGKVES